MTVYVDDMRARYGRMIMCHMIADSMFHSIGILVDREAKVTGGIIDFLTGPPLACSQGGRILWPPAGAIGIEVKIKGP